MNRKTKEELICELCGIKMKLNKAHICNYDKKEKELKSIIKMIHGYCMKYKMFGSYNQEYKNKLVCFYVKE